MTDATRFSKVVEQIIGKRLTAAPSLYGFERIHGVLLARIDPRQNDQVGFRELG